GVWEGALLDPVIFKKLALYLEEIGYFSLSDGYALRLTDYSTAFLSVTKGEQRKIIRNYADGGPMRLWAFQSLLDALLEEQVRWTKKGDLAGSAAR
ncbi:MAG: hypothetical protein KDD44_14220, partial [Bdellovibrionales bacterium]|nr:hypothetical protein [Bdellovibrionales bacterium]